MIRPRDIQKSKDFPVINWLLIIFNTIVFLFDISLTNQKTEMFIYEYGLTLATTSLFGENNYGFLIKSRDRLYLLT